MPVFSLLAWACCSSVFHVCLPVSAVNSRLCGVGKTCFHISVGEARGFLKPDVFRSSLANSALKTSVAACHSSRKGRSVIQSSKTDGYSRPEEKPTRFSFLKWKNHQEERFLMHRECSLARLTPTLLRWTLVLEVSGTEASFNFSCLILLSSKL